MSLLPQKMNSLSALPKDQISRIFLWLRHSLLSVKRNPLSSAVIFCLCLALVYLHLPYTINAVVLSRSAQALEATLASDGLKITVTPGHCMVGEGCQYGGRVVTCTVNHDGISYWGDYLYMWHYRSWVMDYTCGDVGQSC